MFAIENISLVASPEYQFMSYRCFPLPRVALLAAALVATAAAADTLPSYPTSGSANPVTYSFTAAATGDITAWFAGSTAGYTENLGLLINGVPTGVTGLINHASAYGDKLVLGHAQAGDELVFFTDISNTGDTFYSQASRNADGVNHVFATGFGGDGIIPAGTYVGFEDLRGGGDFNYYDETFVFTNVAGAGGTVPEPASWALMITGFGMIGAALRRRAAVVAA
jgi:hypothetical protein